jgi:hypothetical protein
VMDFGIVAPEFSQRLLKFRKDAIP